MNYLFFDIEGANSYGGISKICSFGYVLTDENLEVLDRLDILVNPRSRFNLGPNIKLAYEKDEFKAAGDFTVHYNEIRNLLTLPDTKVLGFAVDNDIKYVRDECRRYDREMFTLDYYDVQRMIREKFALDNQPGLPRACEMLSIEFDQEIHKSDDDAYMTMAVLKALCEKYGKTVEEMIDDCKSCKGHLENGQFRWLDAAPKTEKEIAKRADRITGENGNLETFLNFCESVKPSKKVEKTLEGKRVCISMNYERRKFTQMMNLVQQICNRGGRYTTKATECDIFVTSEYFRSGGRPCVRIESVLDAIGHGAKIELLDFSELLDLLGMTEKQLDKMPLPKGVKVSKPPRKEKEEEAEEIEEIETEEE